MDPRGDPEGLGEPDHHARLVVARGRLIVFEGVEGAGKSTQLSRLAGRLSRSGSEHRVFREPGGTALGDEIRRILLDPASSMTPRAEALLFMASRAELASRELRPSLQRGAIVLLDRFFLSTYAYQIAGRGLPEAAVRSANLVATEGLVPDLTVLLTIPSRVGMERAQRRGARDRIEDSGEAFHSRVEVAFAEFATPQWQRAHDECGPVVAVDASGSEDEVEARVLRELVGRLPGLNASLGVSA